ncbi:MAG: hypothetical protein IKV12_05345 [Alistipes sp.]|nr:hypothetical protein [Alistipes sp.]
MKKILMLLVLVVMCGAAASAQDNFYIPKYKKVKEIRDYDLDNTKRNWTITFGGGFDMALGMQNRIDYKDYNEVIHYNGKPSFAGGHVSVGYGYKLGKHVVAGVESGYAYVDKMNMVPLKGTFKVYYGPITRQHRTRWFNYAHLGPHFYFSKEYKTINSIAEAGVGMRVLMAKTTKIDLMLGYRNSMRRPNFDTLGNYELDLKRVHYQQYIHSIYFGLNFILF